MVDFNDAGTNFNDAGTDFDAGGSFSQTVNAGVASFTWDAPAGSVLYSPSPIPWIPATLDGSGQVWNLAGPANQIISAGVASFAWSAPSATVAPGVLVISSGTAVFVWEAQAASPSVGETINAGVASFSWAAQSPTVTVGPASIAAGMASFAWAAPIPDVKSWVLTHWTHPVRLSNAATVDLFAVNHWVWATGNDTGYAVWFETDWDTYTTLYGCVLRYTKGGVAKETPVELWTNDGTYTPGWHWWGGWSGDNPLFMSVMLGVGTTTHGWLINLELDSIKHYEQIRAQGFLNATQESTHGALTVYNDSGVSARIERLTQDDNGFITQWGLVEPIAVDDSSQYVWDQYRRQGALFYTIAGPGHRAQHFTTTGNYSTGTATLGTTETLTSPIPMANRYPSPRAFNGHRVAVLTTGLGTHVVPHGVAQVDLTSSVTTFEKHAIIATGSPGNWSARIHDKEGYADEAIANYDGYIRTIQTVETNTFGPTAAYAFPTRNTLLVTTDLFDSPQTFEAQMPAAMLDTDIDYNGNVYSVSMDGKDQYLFCGVNIYVDLNYGSEVWVYALGAGAPTRGPYWGSQLVVSGQSRPTDWVDPITVFGMAIGTDLTNQFAGSGVIFVGVEVKTDGSSPSSPVIGGISGFDAPIEFYLVEKDGVTPRTSDWIYFVLGQKGSSGNTVTINWYDVDDNLLGTGNLTGQIEFPFYLIEGQNAHRVVITNTDPSGVGMDHLVTWEP